MLVGKLKTLCCHCSLPCLGLCFFVLEIRNSPAHRKTKHQRSNIGLDDQATLNHLYSTDVTQRPKILPALSGTKVMVGER